MKASLSTFRTSLNQIIENQLRTKILEERGRENKAKSTAKFWNIAKSREG
jgi:hypothetical protein